MLDFRAVNGKMMLMPIELVVVSLFSKKIATHPQGTPQAIPLANYERNPCKKPVGKGCSGCVPVRCVETTLDDLRCLSCWVKALRLASQVVLSKVRVFNAGISACEKGSQWEQSLAIFQHLHDQQQADDPWDWN